MGSNWKNNICGDTPPPPSSCGDPKPSGIKIYISPEGLCYENDIHIGTVTHKGYQEIRVSLKTGGELIIKISH